MSRVLLTQVFPFLLPLRMYQRKTFFYLKMKYDSNEYACSKGKFLDYQVYETSSKLINYDSGYDIKYQYNKVYNLKLAAKTLNGIVIRPNQTFSFWQLVKYAEENESFKNGLNAIRGKMSEVKGGGLCQLSSMLFKMFLHTPLTIIERHSHDSLILPPASDINVRALDATINEGWLDLKVENDTNETFQIKIDFDEENIIGKILVDKPIEESIEIYNEYSNFIKKDRQIFLKTSVDKKIFDLNKQVIRTEHLYTDLIKIDYETTFIKERILEGDLNV